MPKIGETPISQASYGFSKTRLADFQSSEYTLVDIWADASGSVDGHQASIESAIQTAVESCRKSPRADNLLIRFGVFGSNVVIIHDYKLLKEIKPDEYRNSIVPRGMTALREAASQMFCGFRDAAKSLRDHDYEVNAIGFIITDGDDTASSSGPAGVKQACDDLVASEAVDSYRAVVIAINNSTPHFQRAMEAFASTCGFDQIVDVGNATPEALAKLAKFVGSSISSQSSSLGTGSPSQPVSF
jgi:hypothetical protein